MTRKKRIVVIGLVLVGALILAGAAYSTAAWATAGPPASDRSCPVAQTANPADQRAAILDMIEDHMGVTGADAERLADQMIARMQSRGDGTCPALTGTAGTPVCGGWDDDDTGARPNGRMGGMMRSMMGW